MEYIEWSWVGTPVHDGVKIVLLPQPRSLGPRTFRDSFVLLLGQFSLFQGLVIELLREFQSTRTVLMPFGERNAVERERYGEKNRG